MVKIIHVLHAVGGVDVYLRLLLETIDHDRFEHVIIKGLNDNSKPYLKPDGQPIKVYKLPIDREINLINDFSSIRGVVKIFRKEEPNVVHAHSAKGGVIARTASLFYKVNILYTPHAYSYLSVNSGLKRHFFLFLEKCYKNVNSTLLATSESELMRGLKDVGCKKEKAIVFNNSIRPILNFNSLTIERTWPRNYICSVGRPSFQKNIELMLDVLYEIKRHKNDIHLILMGVGYHSPNLSNIQRKIEELHLNNNITLLDWMERDDIFSIVNDSILYLSTSRYEGLPYSVIESLSLGKPIVATDVDGNRDLVINGFNGFLVKNSDIQILSQSVLDIMNNTELRETLSLNSKKLFFKKFNLEDNIFKLESIYFNNF